MRRRRVVGLMGCLTLAVLVPAVGVHPAGAGGAVATTVPATRWLSDISCWPDGSCLAVGTGTRGTGVVVPVSSSGAVGPVRLVPGSLWLYSIDCVPSGGCLAIGEKGAADVFLQIGADGTPGTVRSVSGVDALSDVACPTASTCLATGSVTERVEGYPYFKTWSLFVVFENGQPTVVERLPLDYGRWVGGIDCPTPTTCIAIGGGDVVVLTNIGGSWSARLNWTPAPVHSGHTTDEISCPTSRQCWATAVAHIHNGVGLINVPGIAPVSATGIVGPVRVLIPRQGDSHSISCAPGTSTCTVGGGLSGTASGAFTVDATRGSPSEPTYWANALRFWGVHCVAVESCGLVGSNNRNGVFARKGPSIS